MSQDKPFIVKTVKDGVVHGEFKTFEEATLFTYHFMKTIPDGTKIEITDDVDWIERHVIPAPRTGGSE